MQHLLHEVATGLVEFAGPQRVILLPKVVVDSREQVGWFNEKDS